MLTVPEDKVVITIPDFSEFTENPSISVGDPTDDPNDEPSGSDSSGENTDPEGGSTSNTTPTTKEILTKGKDNTVPTLPTLPPKEEGNIFEGWVDKATGEPVKKGDKLSGSVELKPVWKDCGEGSHTDADENEICDECGYILVKETVPEETLEPEETDLGEGDPKGDDDHDGGKLSTGGIAAIAGSGVAGTALVLAFVLSKKKKGK